MADPHRAWVFADVWAFAAIGVYSRPCSLTEVVASADWINHAILLEDEVESALGKLAGAGLVRVLEGWLFDLTDQGTELWSEAVGHTLQLRLASVEGHLSVIEPGATRVPLPPGAMQQAVRDYTGSPSADPQPS